MELRRNLKRKALADCTNTIPTTTAIPRKPFSDRTNIPTTTTTTTTSVPPKKPFSSSLTKPPKHSITKPPKSSLSIRKSDENSFTSCESNNEENPRIRIPQPSSTPPIPTITTSDSGNCESEDAENPRIRTSDSGNCESDDAENPRIRSQPSTPPRLTMITAANSDDFHCEDSGVGTVYTRRKTVEKTRDKGKAVMVSSSCPPAGRTRNEDQLDKENRDVNLPKSYSYTVACPKAKKKRRTSLPLPRDFIDKQKAYFAEIDAFELPEEVVSESELE